MVSNWFCLEQPHQVGKFAGGDTLRFQQQADPRDKIVQFGNLGQDVVGDDEVCLYSFPAQRSGQLRAKKVDLGGHVFGLGGRGHIPGGLDPQHRDAAFDKILQQVSAAVAGDLDHLAVCVESKSPAGHGRVRPGVFEPGIRVRGEVGIFGENVFRGLTYASNCTRKHSWQTYSRSG